MASLKSEQLMAQAYELCQEGLFDDAISCYDKILSMEPDNIPALVDKAATLQNMGKPKKAILMFDMALKLDPNNVDALLNKGAALHTLNRFDESISSCYDVILKNDAGSALALAYKGLALGEKGDIRSALTHFKKALDIDKDYELALVSKERAEQLLNLQKKSSKKR